MTVATWSQRALPRARHSRAPARRAVVRWAGRMFRREWRRQALILALLTVAVTATTLGLAVVSNSVQPGADPNFGTANTVLTLSGASPMLGAGIAALQHRFGIIDVVAHQSIPVPGSVIAVDLRAENPHGPYVGATLRLDAGRYPSGPGQVAVTHDVAQTLGLHVGRVWHEGGRALLVVGLVENPLNLLDQFALVAPGQADPPSSLSILVASTPSRLHSLNLPGGGGLGIDTRGTASKRAAEALVLVLATLSLLFVGLLAVAGFAVIAQHRLRSLGMLSSLGATDGQVRLVMLANGAAVGATSAIVGAVLGVAGWLAFAPSLQGIVDHRIDRFNLPWWAIGAASALAFVTAVTAAWWPARTASRVPIMVALSGRPSRPQPAHRFAVAGGLTLGAGLVLLAFGQQHKAPFIITGTVASVVGLLLIAPLAIRAMAGMAGRAPISVRLALRDLARYQARSGAALGAATLAVAIAATIAISSAAGQARAGPPNLPQNQLALYVGAGNPAGNPLPVVGVSEQADLQAAVEQLAGTLDQATVLPLEGAYNASAPLQNGPPGVGAPAGGQVTASMARVVTTSNQGQQIGEFVQLYVATPALLAHYGIAPGQINPAADVVTSRSDLGGLQIFLPNFGPAIPPAASVREPPQIPQQATQPTIQIIKGLPVDTSDPTALITSHALLALGLQTLPAGWLLQTPRPLTAAQIATARKVATATGLSVESTSVRKSLAPLRDWSTAAGILVALGVLAMTVGLIRSETSRDLRTLTASGASRTTRRAITGATAGALAILGAVLGTAGAYVALVAWHRSDLRVLTRVPVANLLILVVVLPLVAIAGGWLLAGRQPPAMARQPLE